MSAVVKKLRVETRSAGNLVSAVRRATELPGRVQDKSVRRLLQRIRRLENRCHYLERNQRVPYDTLTRCLTRDHFEELTRKWITQAEKRRRQSDVNRSPLTLVMLDLDNLKVVNDSCGHAAGDEMLRVFGEIARKRLRKDDLVCRYGGDEFACVLRGVTQRHASRIIHDLRKDFENARFAFRRKCTAAGTIPSFSFGMAPYEGTGDSLVKLYKRADRELYKEKRARKNRTQGE